MANEFIARNGMISKGNVVVTGSLTTSGSLTTTGTITATTLVVQTITSSISSVTGSTNFGSLSSDTHKFTGSLNVTGAFYVTTGSVGIGTTSPNFSLHVDSNTAITRFQITNSTTGQGGSVGLQIIQSGSDASITNRSNGYLAFETVGTERMKITSAGFVGIGTTNPTSKLEIQNSPANEWGISVYANTTTGQSYGGIVRGGTNSSDVAFKVNNAANTTAYFNIRGDGNVGIGTSSPLGPLEIRAANRVTSADGILQINTTNSQAVDLGGSLSFGGMYENGGTIPTEWAQIAGRKENSTAGVYSGYLQFSTRPSGGVNTERMRITSAGRVNIGTTTNAGVMVFPRTSANIALSTYDDNTFQISTLLTGVGNLRIEGTLTATTKSFLIPHPLTNLEKTHNLCYVSVESPQADLMYRGKLTLVDGKAQANIDEVSTMTEGTFEVLCKEIQCFTTNESSWDLVKGKVIGNIIYIESQNPNSTDEISWMIVGERKDKSMMDIDLTDDNGKVIVEPLITSNPKNTTQE
jgi:hypothetical protein